ncbi:hypothetical protein HPB51_021985 [Rhipicephalus microplus]|uniref:Uncharacterized protein n=1 Tax=Rhipicephalus microplus TaxID=6941 RepID=A0A9J6DWM0_RHIMP|nr:hypothetical protein HPB51_021985 [Rhipicephalus microplus]
MPPTHVHSASQPTPTVSNTEQCAIAAMRSADDRHGDSGATAGPASARLSSILVAATALADHERTSQPKGPSPSCANEFGGARHHGGGFFRASNRRFCFSPPCEPVHAGTLGGHRTAFCRLQRLTRPLHSNSTRLCESSSLQHELARVLNHRRRHSRTERHNTHHAAEPH